MSFADPQTITISAATTSLPRTKQEGDESQYTSADGLIKLSASHTENRGRERHLLRLDHSKLSADPYKPDENRRVTMAVYIVLDVDPGGYTDAEALAVYTGFKTQMTASSDALVTKLLGGES